MLTTSRANVQVVDLEDGRQVCLSYGTIVAAFIPRDFVMTTLDVSSHCYGIRGGYVRTDEHFSVTSSKHMNQFAGKDAPRIPHAELLRLCAPVKSRR